jgi:ABC-type transport system involved in cytochrome c biogenesis permease subunit
MKDSAASMNGIDPKITTLPLVFKSIWLVIHVSVITSSYGFFGMASVKDPFNVFSLLSLVSVLMKYFGVDLYLSGMDSYASGERAVLPVAAYTVDPFWMERSIEYNHTVHE